jgi:hypothetical protein
MNYQLQKDAIMKPTNARCQRLFRLLANEMRVSSNDKKAQSHSPYPLLVDLGYFVVVNRKQLALDAYLASLDTTHVVYGCPEKTLDCSSTESLVVTCGL